MKTKNLIVLLFAMTMGTSCWAQNECKQTENKVIETIMQRRSIRKYKETPVEKEKLQLIADCGIAAPNAMNRQAWAVRIVDSKDFINGSTEAMKKVNPNITGNDKNMYRNAPAIICVAVPSGDFSYIDAGLMGENMMLAAQSLGLGTCCLGGVAMQLNTRPELKDYLVRLKLPNDYKIAYVLAVGYPDEQPQAKQRDKSKIMFVE